MKKLVLFLLLVLPASLFSQTVLVPKIKVKLAPSNQEIIFWKKTFYLFVKPEDSMTYEGKKYSTSTYAKYFVLPDSADDGNYICFHNDSLKNPAVTASYKNGKLDGAVNHFNENGTLSATNVYFNGLFDGFQINYNEMGNLVTMTEFSKGVKNGIDVSFFTHKPQLPSVISYWKDGKLNGGV